ncbi:hypothetical protein [Paratissierella segnis]|jgi:uncharacterized membrane protein HdeD (DUF308 family)|uniref:C4-dicarboxylate ABC transporter n=1 Tax=Paratissierella segnis TaxID=2763679 RepID=A0A926EXW5_9FIRM|nr:hypothetical protein [Paratissierella segnis]MBC8588517.1 C4-dicarboxylate ABC transporter [Paratissierella segnis]
MTENNKVEKKETKFNDKTGKWLGWLAIIAAVIAFFWQPTAMSIIGIVLGIIGLFSPQRTLNGIAVAIGVIALIVGLV